MENFEQKEKQNYLKNEIINKNYDREIFSSFIKELKIDGGNIDNWTMPELKTVVEKYKKNTQVNISYLINNGLLNDLEINMNVSIFELNKLMIEIGNTNSIVIRTLDDIIWIRKVLKEECPNISMAFFSDEVLVDKNKNIKIKYLKTIQEYIFHIYQISIITVDSKLLKNFFTMRRENFIEFKDVVLLEL